MAYRQLNDIEIQDAHIFNLNFSGVEDQYNPAGRRNFCVEVPDDMVDTLRADGWNVKDGKPKKNNPEESWPAFMKVNVSWKNPRKQPEIYMVTSKKKIELNERTIGRLDSADIQRVDLLIDPSYWERQDGSFGYSAYVKTMYVVINEPSFAERYADIPDSDEEIPF